MTASCNCCRFACASSVKAHPSGAILDWDLMTVEENCAPWRKIVHRELTVMSKKVLYPAGSSQRRYEQCGHKTVDMVSNYTQVCCGFTWCSVGTQSVPRKYSSHHYTTWMDPCFYVVYSKFWPYYLNITAVRDSSNQAVFFQLTNLGECMQTVASVSFS